MTEALASTPRSRGGERPPRARRRSPTPWSTVSPKPVEIGAPDRYCADLLLELAAPLFPAEIVAGSPWAVRLQPPAGGGWVIEVLTLVERWLESTPLPCTKVVYGGRNYLIRSSIDSGFQPAGAAA